MNDIYRLESDGKNFVWEQINLTHPKDKIPEVRTGFGGGCIIDSTGQYSIYIFGGAGESHNKLNDLWKFDGT
jgi:hypothetical protein